MQLTIYLSVEIPIPMINITNQVSKTYKII